MTFPFSGIPSQSSPGQFTPGQVNARIVVIPAVSINFIPTVTSPVVHPIDWGFNAVSAVGNFSWLTPARISLVSPIKWNVVAYGISSSISSSWVTLERIRVISYSINGLCKPVVFPIDISDRRPTITWDVDSRISSKDRFTWKTIGRKTAQKRIAWKIACRITNIQKSFRWVTLHRIFKPGAAIEAFLGIDQAVVHPISSHSYLPNPTSTWTLLSRISPTKKITWNDRIPAKKQQGIQFNTLCNIVTIQKSSQWKLMKRVTSTVSCSFVNVARKSKKQTCTWQLKQGKSPIMSSSFRVRDKVTVQTSSSWRLFERLNINA